MNAYGTYSFGGQKVSPLTTPPQWERPEDIPLFSTSNYNLAQAGRLLGVSFSRVKGNWKRPGMLVIMQSQGMAGIIYPFCIISWTFIQLQLEAPNFSDQDQSPSLVFLINWWMCLLFRLTGTLVAVLWAQCVQESSMAILSLSVPLKIHNWHYP